MLHYQLHSASALWNLCFFHFKQLKMSLQTNEPSQNFAGTEKRSKQLLLFCCSFCILKLVKRKMFLFLRNIRFYQMWENLFAIWRIKKLKNLITVFITTCNTIKIRNTGTKGQWLYIRLNHKCFPCAMVTIDLRQNVDCIFD